MLSDSRLGSQLFVPNLKLTVEAQGRDPNKFRDDQANSFETLSWNESNIINQWLFSKKKKMKES
jgi:hypothetical protein